MESKSDPPPEMQPTWKPRCRGEEGSESLWSQSPDLGPPLGGVQGAGRVLQSLSSAILYSRHLDAITPFAPLGLRIVFSAPCQGHCAKRVSINGEDLQSTAAMLSEPCLPGGEAGEFHQTWLITLIYAHCGGNPIPASTPVPTGQPHSVRDTFPMSP